MVMGSFRNAAINVVRVINSNKATIAASTNPLHTLRLLYRSKQRGFLELDLVLGKWVEDNIHSLDEIRIKALIHVLDLENPDLWKWISGQEQPPESVSTNPVFAAVRERVMKNLDNHSAPEVRATPGQPWVRGWDDIKKGQDGPVSGNQ
uniref:Succinate dehydrogenase assembly factor 2, mitochondrial n=1 Tax=Glycine max TaxID=3847 RepID=I1JXS3_SOYBN